MPYERFTRKVEGKDKYCIKSLDSKKTYCYRSKADREKGAKMHEIFKHMPK
jgi:hypothetical protein